MEPYVHDVLHRSAREMRARAAPHDRHLHEAIAARTAARRSRRLAWVQAVLAMGPRRTRAVRRPASAGGRFG